ncbi:transporter substrate-binding domain-containing protein [Streptococcus suis]|uniref:transporter substrate-binding domain-containing protein n=1 Tax=Streptococcus suis TaxID=1307 RepID=UPI000CF5A5FF|nr:transporter substrate-binding domain-containing protein [Streptococcus suis]
MKIKEFVKTGLVLVVSLSLVACTSSETADNSLKNVQENGKLVVALSPEYPPFEFRALVDGKDTIVGADIELAKEIGKELGVEVEFSAMSFDNVLNSVQNGKVDLAISGISATEERAKVFDFSIPYYTSTNKLIINKANSSQFSSISSLESAKIGVQKGSIQEKIANDLLPNASKVSISSNGELINELKAEKIDGIIFEEPIAKAYVTKNDDLMIVDTEIESNYTDAYAVALPKGSTALNEKVDAVIEKLVSEGKFDTFVQEAYDLSISN